MVDISPFRAFRYQTSRRKEDVSKYICPPYDVISPAGREKLVKKSENNVVRLELPLEGGDAHESPGAIFTRWKEDEILQQDRVPSFYLLETTYRIKDAFAPRKELKRYGVLVGLKLEVPGKGAVLPHEKTLPKAKEDRLRLMHAVNANISPIFGLFFESKDSWKKWVRKAIRGPLLSKGKESAFLSHRMWKIHDSKLIGELKSLVKKKELYIADGHHRYEVAWAFKEEKMKIESGRRRAGWNYVMTYICPMEEEGLLMLPTHRLVKKERSVMEWKKHLRGMFELRKSKSASSLVAALLKSKPEERVLGWICRGGCYWLKLREGISIDLCLPHRSPALRSLDSVLLHDLILEEAAGEQYVKDQTIFFMQDLDEMQKRIKKDPSLTGFVLRSAGVNALAKVASEGQVMPPKTTYFYPKVPTGFAIMPLDQKIQ